MSYQHPLTEREKFLVKIAIASTLEAVKNVLIMTEVSMHDYREKTEGDPRKKGYYDTHRQFKELEYCIDQEIRMRVHYDDDLAENSWLIK